MNSWPLETQSRASPFWIPSGFFRIIFVQHWNQGSPGQILFEKKHRFVITFVEIFSKIKNKLECETDLIFLSWVLRLGPAWRRNQQQKKQKRNQGVSSKWLPCPCPSSQNSVPAKKNLLRVCCLSLTTFSFVFSVLVGRCQVPYISCNSHFSESPWWNLNGCARNTRRGGGGHSIADVRTFHFLFTY